jgi:ABC-type enterobactin transport system permease subunit
MIPTLTILLVLILSIEQIYLYTHRKQIIKMLESIQKFENINIKVYSAIIGYVLMSIALYLSTIKYEFTYLDILMLGICVNGVYQAFSFAMLNKWSLTIAIINTLWGGILFLSVAFLYRNIIL